MTSTESGITIISKGNNSVSGRTLSIEESFKVIKNISLVQTDKFGSITLMDPMNETSIKSSESKNLLEIQKGDGDLKKNRPKEDSQKNCCGCIII